MAFLDLTDFLGILNWGLKFLVNLPVKLLKQNIVSFDTETTSLDALKAELVGIAFSWERSTGYYLPFPENRNQSQAIILKLKPFFESEKIKKIGHNLKYDLKKSLQPPSSKDLSEEQDEFNIEEFLDEQISVNAKMNNTIKSTLQRFDNTYNTKPNNNIIISENNSSEEDDNET